MEQISTVHDIVSLWPSRPEFARDLALQAGIEATSDHVRVLADRIRKWAHTGVIPASQHGRILRAAKVRGFALRAEDMVRVHDVDRSYIA